MSYDCEQVKTYAVSMPSRETATAYKRAFTSRVKSARLDCGKTQDEMATLLGIKQDQYKQYERRSMLPHRFIEPFCIGTGVAVEWLITGKHKVHRVISRRTAA